jgi:hypothetical protein
MIGSGTNSEDLGYSICMGPKLRKFVEKQLLEDLNHYVQPIGRFKLEDVRFDWSESCVEGHRIHWLDGEIENFSSITIFDDGQKLVAEGWMEFIETETGLDVFWWFLRGGETYDFQDKTSNEVSKHVWERLSPKVRADWSQYPPNNRRLP